MNKHIEQLRDSVRRTELIDRLNKQYTVAELNYLYSRIELEEPKKTIKKKVRAEALAYYILNMPNRIIACLTPGEILWLNELIERKVMHVEKSAIDFLTLSLLFDLKFFHIYRLTIDDENQHVAVIFDDIINAYSEPLKKAVSDIKHRTNLSVVRTYISGLLNLCGFLSMQEITIAIASEGKLPQIDEKELKQVFDGFKLISNFSDDMPEDIWFASNNFVNIDSISEIVAKRDLLPLYPVFSYLTIMKAALFPMPELPAEIVTPLAEKVQKVITSKREAIEFITNSWLFLQVLSPMEFLKTTIGNLDILDLDIKEATNLVQDMSNTLPRFEFYGHSSIEALLAKKRNKGKVKPRMHLGELLKGINPEEIDSKKVSKLIDDALFDEFSDYLGTRDDIEGDSDSNNIGEYIARNSITPWVNKNTKVGRNDPCPCGSGKKYKNCCGRSK